MLSQIRNPFWRALLAVGMLSALMTAAGTVNATARTDAAPNVPNAAPSSCPRGDFCAYQGVNYTGKEQKMGPCRVYELEGSGWSGIGSWYNNQSDGIQARMAGKNLKTIYVTPGAPSHDTQGNWAPVWYIQNC
jgi:Peptidase inhibitor family I36